MDVAAGAASSTPATIARLVVPAEAVELASDALWQRGPSAVLEESQPGGEVRLTADVTDLEGIDGLGEQWPMELLGADGADHLDAWRAWARPVRAGQRFLLVPTWLAAGGAPLEPSTITLVLDPGRAFGSGSHPSTRLVLAAMEHLVEPKVTVLDVGTGSGVLAVAACLLGAGAVVAVDVDPAAVTATAANARANGVADRVDVSVTPLVDVSGEFELVVANIGARVLRELAGALRDRVGPGGHLVLAGLLVDQADAVVAAFARAGAFERERLEEDGWVAVVLAVPSSAQGLGHLDRPVGRPAPAVDPDDVSG